MIVIKDGIELVNQVKAADTFIKRLLGLMGAENLSEQEGLFLENCSSIHCFFMKTTIDAVYLSKDLKVLEIETLRPWSIGKRVKGASHVLELAEGSAVNKLNIGDQLIMIKK